MALFTEDAMSIEKIITSERNINTGSYRTDWLVYRFGSVHEDVKYLATHLAGAIRLPYDWNHNNATVRFEDILDEVYRRMKRPTNSKYTVSKTINRWPGIQVTTQWLTEDCLEVKVEVDLAVAA